MRRKFYPGEAAPAGTYWSSKTLEMVTISEDGEHLPAGEGVYWRAPPALMLLAAPFIGLVFVIFLPFAVPLIAIHAAVTRAIRAAPWTGRRGEERARVRWGR